MSCIPFSASDAHGERHITMPKNPHNAICSRACFANVRLFHPNHCPGRYGCTMDKSGHPALACCADNRGIAVPAVLCVPFGVLTHLSVLFFPNASLIASSKATLASRGDSGFMRREPGGTSGGIEGDRDSNLGSLSPLRVTVHTPGSNEGAELWAR